MIIPPLALDRHLQPRHILMSRRPDANHHHHLDAPSFRHIRIYHPPPPIIFPRPGPLSEEHVAAVLWADPWHAGGANVAVGFQAGVGVVEDNVVAVEVAELGVLLAHGLGEGEVLRQGEAGGGVERGEGGHVAEEGAGGGEGVGC